MRAQLYAVLGATIGAMFLALLEVFVFYFLSVGYSRLPPSYGAPLTAVLGVIILVVHVRGTWATVHELGVNGSDRANPLRSMLTYRLKREFDWFIPRKSA